MKRILSLFLTAAMLAALLVFPAAADSAPWVQIDGGGTAGQTVSVRGLSGEYHAVQLTLHLNRAPGAFQFDQSIAGAGGHTTYSVEGNTLTLYATAKGPISQNGTIVLGALPEGQSFTVNSVSNLKLLSMGSSDVKEQTLESVSLNSSGQGPSGGSGVISGGNGPVTPPAGTGTGDATSKPEEEPAPVVLPFTDVKDTDWFRDAVAYAYENGLMNGTSRTTFSPDGVTTRGMIVTILHRLEGAPEAGTGSFPDVAEGKFYTGAVAWAAANGVVKGYNDGRFGPDDNITREQMAVILYRYAQYKGYDVSGRADLSAYADGEQVSGFALEAMAWANQAGLITGASGNTLLLPVGHATRSQVATILMRFCENVVK